MAAQVLTFAAMAQASSRNSQIALGVLALAVGLLGYAAYRAAAGKTHLPILILACLAAGFSLAVVTHH